MKSLETELSPVERAILLLLCATGGKVSGKLWFQKEMFELSKAFKNLAEDLDFNAYSYGPFSEALEEYRDMLENSGLIKNLKLTDKGREIAEKIWAAADAREIKIVKGTADFLETLSDDELLLFIYVTSPEMAESSDVRDHILKKRVEVALKILKENKISVSLASKLAGLSITELSEEAIKRGIRPFEVKEDAETIVEA